MEHNQNKDYHYRLIDGRICLFDPDGEQLTSLQEVAIGYSRSDGHCVLHKHGNPESVLKWATNARERYIAVGFDEMAQEIEVIIGRFPIEELNKVISCTGYIDRLCQKIKNNEITPI